VLNPDCIFASVSAELTRYGGGDSVWGNVAEARAQFNWDVRAIGEKFGVEVVTRQDECVGGHVDAGKLVRLKV
jgi:hypothetical protein